MWQELLFKIQQGDIKSLSRCISLIENEHDNYIELLQQLPVNTAAKIIGITGPPGAGKSTLTDALTGEFIKQNKKIGILCVDPSSPFNMGSILGDRIRMSEWYTHPNVFIRSLATRGSMGGLHPKIIEITDLMKTASFDFIIVETVGVGQSEIEIAGLADTTIVVFVPESGDEVQTMKAGLMEIADVFVVNKSDRPDADAFVKNLRLMLAPTFSSHKNEVPIIKTVATEGSGIKELWEIIEAQECIETVNEKKLWLLTDKVYLLIQQERMRNVTKHIVRAEIASRMSKGENMNLYQIVQKFK